MRAAPALPAFGRFRARSFEAVQASARECGVDVAQLLAGLRTFSQWRRQHATRSRRPSEWASAFAQAAAIDRRLFERLSVTAGNARSQFDEYQALARWQELLAEFAALDRTVGRLAAAAALGKLERLARETIFQPEGGAPPVQVLGVLEANALTFDHLWIMGLTGEAWPPPSRPDPLLPIELQRAAGMPGASAAAELRASAATTGAIAAVGPGSDRQSCDRRRRPADRAQPDDRGTRAWVAPPRAARLIDVMKPSRH